MAKSRSKNEKMERRYFNNAAKETIELPNLIDVQLDSFKNFVEKGVNEVLNEKFPIQSNNGNYTLSYVTHTFLEPKNAIEECKNHNKTYERDLNITLTLLNKSNQETRTTESGLLCKIPWMTDTGTFIIKGVERIIVNQLIRAPGAYYKKDMDKNGVETFECDIHPQSGTYLQIETDAKKAIYIKIDKQKRILATVFFRALGLTKQDDFTRYFGNNEFVKATIEKDAVYASLNNDKSNSELIAGALKEVFDKVKPGEPMGKDAGIALLRDKYFAPKRYDLGKTGRYKLKTKLSLYSRMLNKYLAEDIFDENGVTVLEKGTYLDANVIDNLKESKVFDKGGCTEQLEFVDPRMEKHDIINIVTVSDTKDLENSYNIIGTEQNIDDKVLTIPDIFAAFNYFVIFVQTPESEPIGQSDDIDHLSNRKVKTVGELLQEKLGVGLTRLSKKILEKMSTTTSDDIVKEDKVSTYLIPSIVNGVFDEFFSTSQLSQFMDQTNPLAELTNKRRLSALGPGGITRDRASMEVRDVHYSHYGRICPVETPEGPNVGLINNLCCFGRINEYGFIETPYRKVVKVDFNGEERYEVVSKAIYLTADDELDRNIADTSIKLKEEDGRFFIDQDSVVVRYRDEVKEVSKEDVHYVDVSPKQIVSIASACIPFLENNDGKRALMGANMQKQSVPLIHPSSPYVGTGVEARIAKDSGTAILAKEDGVVTYIDGFKIVVKGKSGEITYKLVKFERSNQCTSITQTPIVFTGQKVEKGQVIADGPSMDNGEIALGQNVTVAFMTWDGYNFEDAVIMSERLVKDDVFTSVHIEEYECNCRQTQSNGQEEITRDIGEISSSKRTNLDENGIVIRGSRVAEGDILVGKKTPKGEQDNESTNKLINSILEKSKTNMKNTSLTVPHGGDGIVIDTQILSRENNDELNAGILKTIKVYVAQKRKISEGDKMAGRYGNKGVISKIVPEEDMPFLPDGTPVDILLNPVGVPKRMNIGQVLELHLGAAAKKLGYKVASPVFASITMEQISKMMEEAKMDPDGKTVLYDGKTGEPYNERISVGVMYMIKLSHMVDDKIHARATGPYSLITQQPLGGKAQKGGQRFGEMEVWALEAYGAAYTLQEMMTIKSDDTTGRRLAYKNIEEGRPIPDANMPECFKVLQKELKGLGLNCQIFDKDNKEIKLSDISLESEEDLQEKARATKESISLGKEYQEFEYANIETEETGISEEEEQGFEFDSVESNEEN